MSVSNIMATYRCPLCQQSLIKENKIFRCINNHCFDLAKEGYLNLLPVQFKHSKNPGDNKAMVNARRSFLEQGYYQPLVDRLINIYQDYGNTSKPLFDAGCGEGFYTHQHKNEHNQVYGIDIAKEAIKKAAKKYPQCHFSVGTLSQLPFNDDFFNWVLSVYAPIIEPEFTRVLENKGFLLTVTPGKKHLFELKSLIYQNVQEHDIEREAVTHLTLVHQEQLTYTMNIQHGIETLNLLSMTPFAFKASEEIKKQLMIQSNFTCQADFLIKLYQKV